MMTLREWVQILGLAAFVWAVILIPIWFFVLAAH